MKRGLLSRIAENNRNSRAPEQKMTDELRGYDDEFVPFEFEGKKYYVTVRDNVLIFDSNMLLIHTLSKSDVYESSLPLLMKVSQIISNSFDAPVKLYVKRNGKFESISFYNRFDATFILKKLKRVASRPDENIEELYIEDSGAIVEHFTVNVKHKRFGRNMFRRKRESDTVIKLTNVEDALESIISEILNNPNQKLDNEKVDQCIELLQGVKNED